MKTSKIASFLAVVVCPGALPVGKISEAVAENFSQNVNEQVSDSQISRNVKNALSRDVQFEHAQIQVETHQGIVRLAGGVNTPVQKRHAAELAHGVYGVRHVQNRIAVKDLFRHFVTGFFSGLHNKTH